MLEAYRSNPDEFTSTVAEREHLPLSWWEGRLARAAFGAFVEANLVGAVAVSFEARERTRHKADLIGLYVSPQFRKQGCGRGLIQAVIDFCAAEPEVLLLQLTAAGDNARAIALYESLGFRRFGLEPYAVRRDHDFVARAHLWRPLKGLPEV